MIVDIDQRAIKSVDPDNQVALTVHMVAGSRVIAMRDLVPNLMESVDKFVEDMKWTAPELFMERVEQLKNRLRDAADPFTYDRSRQT